MVASDKGEAKAGDAGQDAEKFVVVRWPGRVHHVLDKLNGDEKLKCIIQDDQCKPVNLVTLADVKRVLPFLPKGSCTKLEDAKPLLPSAIAGSKDDDGLHLMTKGPVNTVINPKPDGILYGDPMTGPGKIRCLRCGTVNELPEFDIENPPFCAGMDKAEHKGKSKRILTCWAEESD